MASNIWQAYLWMEPDASICTLVHYERVVRERGDAAAEDPPILQSPCVYREKCRRHAGKGTSPVNPAKCADASWRRCVVLK